MFKFDSMRFLTIILLLVVITTFAQKTTSPSVNTRIIKVYTSADDTDLRFTPTGEFKFTPLAQPLETQSCVFVYPTKKRQAFLGIGGAITDASAEVFAKKVVPITWLAR